MTERDNQRLTSRLRRAGLRHTAVLEDLDYHLNHFSRRSATTATQEGLNPPGFRRRGLEIVLLHEAEKPRHVTALT